VEVAGVETMKSISTIRKHIRALRAFIDRPVSDENALEHIVQKRIAYTVETVLHYETEEVVGWRPPLQEVIEESEILVNDIRKRACVPKA
jgi:hypothetical protein